MPLQPDPPFPKTRGNAIRAKDWNDTVNEVVRLDQTKLNQAGGTVAGNLAVTGNLSANGTISGNLAPNIVGANQIASNAVTADKVANGAVAVSKLRGSFQIRSARFTIQQGDGELLVTLGYFPVLTSQQFVSQPLVFFSATSMVTLAYRFDYWITLSEQAPNSVDGHHRMWINYSSSVARSEVMVTAFFFDLA